MKLIRSSSPLLFLCVKIEAIVSSEEKEYIIKYLLKSGLINTGAVEIACLMLLKAH
jgi:hypothetical protein